MLAGAASRSGLRTQSNGVYGSSVFKRDFAAVGAGVDASITSGFCCSDSWSGDGTVDGVALDAVVVEGGVAEASYVEGVEVGIDIGAVDEDEGTVDDCKGDSAGETVIPASPLVVASASNSTCSTMA